MTTLRLWRIALPMAALVVMVAGCAKLGPEAVAKSFVDAMRKGNLEQAASYWDYITYARRENPDWDTIGTSQRNLIIKELAKTRARELEFWRGHFPLSCRVEEVVVEADRAIAALAEGRAGELHLVKVDDGWYVSNIR